MKLIILTAAVMTLAAFPAMAQTEVGNEPNAAKLATADPQLKGRGTLSVSTPAFAPGGDIPLENTQYRSNTFPGLSWSAGPKGTAGYAVIMQDDDGDVQGMPVLHWTMFNIPAGVTKLSAGMTQPPSGAINGPNVRGPNHAYMGPRTPPGPKHHYHLQVFALDTILPSDLTLTYPALLDAMRGHVLASGQVVGLGRADTGN